MDWLQEIRGFPKLKLDSDSSILSEREKTIVLQKYRKALKNAVSDSVDIAVIELRKLVVLYPDLGQINLLLGCCQMLEGHRVEAIENFKKARSKDLPSGMDDLAETYIKEGEKQILDGVQATQIFRGKVTSPEIIAAKPGRWKKRKMATKKEKKEISRKLESPQIEETFIREGRNINWVKLGAVLIILAGLAGIIIAAAMYLPQLIRSSQETRNETSERLEWLLDELGKRESENPSIEEILRDYDLTFYPDTVSSFTPIPTPTPVVTPEDPTPSPSPEPTLKNVILAAYEDISEAEEIGRDDPARVRVLISKVVEALEGIDENTTAGELQVNMGDILQKAYQLEKSVVNAACYPYYRDGKQRMEEKDYAAAIDAFKKAYDIDPDYLDGGNTYNLAKAYAAAGQQSTANEYFQYVVDTFPGSDHAGWAASRIVPDASEDD